MEAEDIQFVGTWDAFKKGKQVGRKEVVECLVNDFHFSPIEGCEHYRMWQAKLKDWNIH